MFTTKDHEPILTDPSENLSANQSDESREALKREAAEYFNKLINDLYQIICQSASPVVGVENQNDTFTEESEDRMDKAEESENRGEGGMRPPWDDDTQPCLDDDGFSLEVEHLSYTRVTLFCSGRNSTN